MGGTARRTAPVVMKDAIVGGSSQVHVSTSYAERLNLTTMMRLLRAGCPDCLLASWRA
ncbi:MAG: hypothetical protein AAF907_06620 [Planctomycetota bacterium]